MILPSSFNIPQCPCEVKAQRHTSAKINNDGKAYLNSFIPNYAGPSTYLPPAPLPRSSLEESLFKIPKTNTDFNPFLTKGSKFSTIFLYPYLYYPGKLYISVNSFGSSETKTG